MRNYELSMLLNPSLQEEEAMLILQQTANLFQESQGIIQAQSLLGKRNLPAPIMKQKEAYLGYLMATVPPESIAQIEKKLKDAKEVLRFILTIKKYRAMKTKAPRLRKVQKPLAKEGVTEPKMEIADIDKKIEEMIEKTQ